MLFTRAPGYSRMKSYLLSRALTTRLHLRFAKVIWSLILGHHKIWLHEVETVLTDIYEQVSQWDKGGGVKRGAIQWERTCLRRVVGGEGVKPNFGQFVSVFMVVEVPAFGYFCSFPNDAERLNVCCGFWFFRNRCCVWSRWSAELPISIDFTSLLPDLLIQWYLGIRPLWNKPNFIYVLFGREKFCLVYDLCLEYDSRARTCMSPNESWHYALLSSSAPY
jgi:hypothetical protein